VADKKFSNVKINHEKSLSLHLLNSFKPTRPNFWIKKDSPAPQNTHTSQTTANKGTHNQITSNVNNTIKFTSYLNIL